MPVPPPAYVHLPGAHLPGVHVHHSLVPHVGGIVRGLAGALRGFLRLALDLLVVGAVGVVLVVLRFVQLLRRPVRIR
jgi:hypothetical protein